MVLNTTWKKSFQKLEQTCKGKDYAKENKSYLEHRSSRFNIQVTRTLEQQQKCNGGKVMTGEMFGIGRVIYAGLRKSTYLGISLENFKCQS